MLDGTNRLRLFQEMRLHPWVPSQKKAIDGHLAMMMVEDPVEAEVMKKRYEDKLAVYLAEHPTEEVKEEIKEEVKVEVKEEVEEAPVEAAPKKKTSKKKTITPLAE